MKPNFKEMTRKELVAYVKEHRTDDDAIRELFINRRDPNAVRHPAEQTPEQIKEILEQKIKQKQQES